MYVKAKWKSLSHVRLFESNYRVHAILQARILEWVAFPFSRESSQPRDGNQASHIAGRLFTSRATREVKAKVNIKPRYIMTDQWTNLWIISFELKIGSEL